MNALVNQDTDDAKDKLTAIYDLIYTASQTAISSRPTSPQMAVRPELTRPGRKPQMTKAVLYTVGFFKNSVAKK